MLELQFGRPGEINIGLGVAPGEEGITGGQDESDYQEHGLLQHNAALLTEQIWKKESQWLVWSVAVVVVAYNMVKWPDLTHCYCLTFRHFTAHLEPGTLTVDQIPFTTDHRTLMIDH